MSDKKPQQKNVLGQPLMPLENTKEGFHKNGLCYSSPKDDPTSNPHGNFSVAATLTHSFLQCEYGDDPPYKGHKAGQKMFLSAHDFMSAMREMGPDLGPKVHLESTSERALEVVTLEELKRFAYSKGGKERGGFC